MEMNFKDFRKITKNHEPVLLPWFQYFVYLSEHPLTSCSPRSIVRVTNAPQMTLKQTEFKI